MRIFNRIFVTLLLAGLLVLGVYGVIYSFQISGYSLSNLEQRLGIPAILGGTQSFLESLGQSALPAAAVAVLAGVAVLGLILLIMELKPRKPRKVRTRAKNVYMTRRAVRSAVQSVAEGSDQITSTSKTKAKPRRGAGAKVMLKANVRRGEGQASSSIRDQLNSELSDRGVPVRKLKLKLQETEPQGEKARVS